MLVKHVKDDVNALQASLARHLDGLPQQHKELIETMLHQAFPDGDPDGHRRHHEAVIKAEKERAEFWKSMREALARYGLIGFGGWACYALWQAFLKGPPQ